MPEVVHFAGIDVSAEQLDLCVTPVGIVGQYPNTPGGVKRLIKALRPLAIGRVVVEPSGGYEEAVLAALVTAAIPVRRVNAAKIRAFAFGVGQRAKTDKLDAQILAKFAAQDDRPLYVPPTEAETCLQELMSRRQQVLEQLLAEKQRRQRATVPAVRRSIDRVIKILEKELVAMDEASAETVREDSTLQRHDTLLQSVPGIGPIVSRSLLAFLPELGTLDPKPLAALAGVAPFARESGKWKGKRFILGGRADARRALYQAAQSGAYCNPLLIPLFQRLNPDRTRHKTAVVAGAHKLLRICNALLRDNIPWRAPVSNAAPA